MCRIVPVSLSANGKIKNVPVQTKNLYILHIFIPLFHNTAQIWEDTDMFSQIGGFLLRNSFFSTKYKFYETECG